MANYQWYPGHMTKAKRMMQEDIKLVDVVIELVDARAPLSSRNPDIDELGKNKSRIILLNKSDLADPIKNKAWMTYFADRGSHVLEINAKTGAVYSREIEVRSFPGGSHHSEDYDSEWHH